MTLQGLDSGVPEEDGEDFDDDDDDDKQFCLDESDAGFDAAPDFDGVQDFSGSWCAASHHLLPQGFLKGAQPNIMSVSKLLGITYLDCLYIRYFLGPESFQKLLVAFGAKSAASPVEADYQCHGLPAVGNIPAQPCRHHHSCTNYCLAGGNTGTAHSLYGHFMCSQCMAHKGFERRERASLKNGEDLDEKQQARLDNLDNRLVVQRGRVAKQRQEDVQIFCLDYVQWYERTKNQGFQRRQNQRFLKLPNGTEMESLKKRKADEEQKRQANGKKKKAGFHRESKANKMYPAKLMASLKVAARRLVQMSGKEIVESNCIIDLFDMFVVQAYHKRQLQGYKIQILDNGKPFPYLEKAYHKAVEGILEKATGRKRAWQVLETPSGGSVEVLRGVTDKDLVQRVFESMV